MSLAKDKLPSALAQFDLLAVPGHLLRRNHQRAFDIFSRHVGNDLTRQQFALMLALGQRPGASQRDLVEATSIDKSTLKEMLGRLVTRGWVRRERDPRDSRAWMMDLTGEGKALLLDNLASVQDAQREIMAPLSKEEQVTLLRLLRTLLGHDEDVTAAFGRDQAAAPGPLATYGRGRAVVRSRRNRPWLDDPEPDHPPHAR
jgi:DNA-binding MarR family transcriptional regulator